ncbi:MAG: cation transporting ATPase C-terminal domain-containing protein, partial [Candidatus Delongbacteria bacterium]|nr:cation transporting ATPase C-terminal domain-containing protein [Candidatus Delongbacteria bacterium]
KPRGRDDHIINKGSSIEIVFFGILMGGLAFANYGYFISRMGSFGEGSRLHFHATTISYVTIVACQFINILSRRYETITIFNMTLFTNRKIIYSIVLSIVMCAVVIYVPGVNTFLKFAPLKAYDLMTIFVSAMIFLFAHEMLKVFKRRRVKSSTL